MLDFRLKVFYTVAKELSFTKAAQALFISQPAVTKHIHELERQVGIALFERIGNKIQLTVAGKILYHHAIEIFQQYRSLTFDIQQLKEEHAGELNLGASSTIAHYVLPRYMAKFYTGHPNVQLTLLNGNTSQVENALINKDIQLGVVEGNLKNPSIKYSPFMQDEIILVANPKFATGLGKCTVKKLTGIPLLLREQGSGTLQVITEALMQYKIKRSELKVPIQLGSTESIKSYLYQAPVAAFLSKQTLQTELDFGLLKQIELPNFKIERKFYFIQLQGHQDKLAQTFIKFMKQSLAADES